MRELLRANFRRLRWSKIFWIAFVGMLLWTVFLCVLQYVDQLKYGNETYIVTLDEMLFRAEIVLGIVIAVFVSLFVGVEYGDGTIRNKILVGRKRRDIYMANVVACGCAGLAVYGVSVGAAGFLSMFLFAESRLSLPELLGCCGIGAMMTLAFTAVFCLIAMLCANKTHTAVGCLLLSFLLMFGAIYVYQRLSEPEYVQQVSASETYSDVTVVTYATDLELETVPNPCYLSGVKREIYQFLLDVNPMGQAVQLSSLELVYPVRIVIYDLCIMGLTCLLGLAVFRKKDIK